MNLDSRIRKKKFSLLDEMLPKSTQFLYKDHDAIEEVRRKIYAAIRKYNELLTLLKKWKLRWFCHVSRFSSLVETKGHIKRKEKSLREKKSWEDSIKDCQEWTLPAQLG